MNTVVLKVGCISRKSLKRPHFRRLLEDALQYDDVCNMVLRWLERCAILKQIVFGLVKWNR
jgi:hypothetical protein